MASHPRVPRTREAGRRPVSSFAVAGIITLGITAIAIPLGLFNGIPFVGALLKSSDSASMISALVLIITLWVMLFAAIRARYVKRTGATLTRAREDLVNQAGSAGSAYESVASRSELDHAHSEVAYGPARALVWALPALGFLGTATEMASAVHSLGASVGSSNSYPELRNALTGNVIPPLGNAFGVTLFALGASVVCHLLLTWTSSREQRMLLEVEEYTLALTGKGTHDASVPAELDKHMGFLALAVREAARSISETARSAAVISEATRSAAQRAVPDRGQTDSLLRSVDQRLGLIHDELAQDRVIIAARRPVGPSGAGL